MSKLFNPERPEHSLESYGKQFGRNKPVHEDWSVFSEAMLHRCSEDVEINYITYKHLVDKYCRNWNWLKSLEIEQEFALYRAYQEIEGVDIDVESARQTLEKLDKEIDELTNTLLDRIPKRVSRVGSDNGYKPFKKNGDYTEATRGWFNL